MIRHAAKIHFINRKRSAGWRTQLIAMNPTIKTRLLKTAVRINHGQKISNASMLLPPFVDLGLFLFPSVGNKFFQFGQF